GRAQPAEVHVRRDLPVQQLVRTEESPDAAERPPHVRLVGQAGAARPGEQPVVDLAEVPGGAEGDTLVVELVDDQVPALADLADHHADRDADVRVVGGVGVVAAVHGGDGRPGEAGVVRGDDHHGDALVPPGVRVGAG